MSTITRDQFGNWIYQRPNEESVFIMSSEFWDWEEDFFNANKSATYDDYLESVRVSLDGAY